MNNPVEKFILTLTRTQTMQVEVSESRGYEMPKDIKGVIVMDRELREDPESFFDDQPWVNDPVKIESIDIIE